MEICSHSPNLGGGGVVFLISGKAFSDFSVVQLGGKKSDILLYFISFFWPCQLI